MVVCFDLIVLFIMVVMSHFGVDLVDFFVDIFVLGGFNETVLGVLADSLGTIFDLLTGTPEPQDSIAVLHTLSSDGVVDFNRCFLAGFVVIRCGASPTSSQGILLFSWAGSSVLTNLFDLSN